MKIHSKALIVKTLVVSQLMFSFQSLALADNQCLDIYKGQRTEARQLTAVTGTSPLTTPVIATAAGAAIFGLSTVASAALIKRKGIIVGGVGGIFLVTGGAILGGLVAVSSILGIPKDLLYTTPKNAIRARNINKILTVLDEVEEIWVKYGGQIPDDVKMSDKVEDLYLKLKGRSKNPESITAKKMIETIAIHSKEGTFCPQGTVYYEKGVFNAIVQGLMENDQYQVPEKFYKHTAFFVNPFKTITNKGLRTKAKTLNDQQRFDGKEDLYNGKFARDEFAKEHIQEEQVSAEKNADDKTDGIQFDDTVAASKI